MAKISPAVLTLTTFCAVFLIGFWLVLLPQLRELGLQQSRLEKQSGSIKAAAKPGNVVPSPTTNPTQQLADQALVLLPPKDKQYDLIIQIEALSKTLAMPLGSLTVTGAPLPNAAPAASSAPATTGIASAAVIPKTTPQNAAPKLTINCSVTGTYADVQRFVSGLLSIDRLIHIDQVTLGGQAAASGSTTATVSSDQLTAQIAAFAYYLPS